MPREDRPSRRDKREEFLERQRNAKGWKAAALRILGFLVGLLDFF
jgi:hypothetical protein